MFSRSVQLMIHCLVLIGLLGLTAGCDDFQSEKFALSNLDAEACTAFTDTSAVVTAIKTVALVNLDTTWYGDRVNANAGTIMDSLAARGLIVESGQKLYQLNTPGKVDTNYVVLSAGAGEFTLFVDDYVLINLIDAGGGVAAPSDRSISLEAVFECPEIRTRLVFPLSSDRALLQIIKTDQTMASRFRLIVMK